MMNRADPITPPEDQVTETGLSQSYRTYYTTGHYDRRYPRPNQTTLDRIRTHLTPQTHLIDFGCGNGRYLLAMHGHVARAAGFDISSDALDMLTARAADMGWDDLAILGPDPEALTTYRNAQGPVDVVLCLFGVLAHIDDPAIRAEKLKALHGLLKPSQGRLLLSLPNRRRRFLAEQREAGPDAEGRIRYRREMDGTSVDLPYQLFDPERLQAELTTAGFVLEDIRSESVFPENWLTNSAIWRALDRLLNPLCPARWGYGIWAVARPGGEGRT